MLEVDASFAHARILSRHPNASRLRRPRPVRSRHVPGFEAGSKEVKVLWTSTLLRSCDHEVPIRQRVARGERETRIEFETIRDSFRGALASSSGTRC
jgi:hypothetical protein